MILMLIMLTVFATSSFCMSSGGSSTKSWRISLCEDLDDVVTFL